MRLLITTQKHADAAALIDDVRTVGTKLQAAKPVGAPPARWAVWPASRALALAGGAACVDIHVQHGLLDASIEYTLSARTNNSLQTHAHKHKKQTELVIGNIVRRVLHMVREEEQADGGDGGDGDEGTEEEEEQAVSGRKQDGGAVGATLR